MLILSNFSNFSVIAQKNFFLFFQKMTAIHILINLSNLHTNFNFPNSVLAIQDSIQADMHIHTALIPVSLPSMVLSRASLPSQDTHAVAQLFFFHLFNQLARRKILQLTCDFCVHHLWGLLPHY